MTGRFAAVDVHYPVTGSAQAGCVVATDIRYQDIVAEHVAALAAAARPPGRCSSPRPGSPAPKRPNWSSTWPVGTGCRTRCAGWMRWRAEIVVEYRRCSRSSSYVSDERPQEV